MRRFIFQSPTGAGWLGLLLACAVLSHGGEVASDSAEYGERNFTEYQPGGLPLVIVAPHGGKEKPEDIPDRTTGVMAMDANTQELVREMADIVKDRTGLPPHVVVCRLHRSKVDVNRPLPEAAEGNPAAELAWREHHGFIEKACAAAVARHGFAFLIDMHGHGHPDSRVELGYLHSPEELAECPDIISSQGFVESGSLAWLAERSKKDYGELIWGEKSLGALLEARGFPATPSPRMPVPTVPFFRGGYTVSRHCNATRHVTGLQIEANRPKLRDTEENRRRFAVALYESLDQYLGIHLRYSLSGARRRSVSTRSDMSD